MYMELFLLAVVVGYVFGCVNGKQWMTSLNHFMVKKAGSNKEEIITGWKLHIGVSLIDITKGILAILLIKWAIPQMLVAYFWDYYYAIVYLTAAMVITGHHYPMQLKFKGGKNSTIAMLGVLFAIDWKIGLIALSSFAVIAYSTDSSALGTISMYFMVLFATSFFDFGLIAVLYTLYLTMLGIYKQTLDNQQISQTKFQKVTLPIKKSFGL